MKAIAAEKEREIEKREAVRALKKQEQGDSS
jgi:hypothetical protein